jgi:hypothetical protein
MALSLQQSYSYHRSSIYDASLAAVTAISFVDAVVLKGLPIFHRLDVLVIVVPCHTIYTFFCQLLQPELINRQIGFPRTIYNFMYSYPLLCAIWAVWTRLLGKGELSSHAPVAAIVSMAVYCQGTFVLGMMFLSESLLWSVGLLCCSALFGVGIIVSYDLRQKED